MSKFQYATINESLCIGCTKCLPACPVDAIVGAQQQLHTVIKNECIGCGLCLPPCPMDCISIHSTDEPLFSKEKAKDRFQQRQVRLNALKRLPSPIPPLADRQQEIQAILQSRIKA